MITQCHDKYLKDTLEPDDEYPYHELYAWSYFYIANKTNPYTLFKWSSRYDSLKQDTSFFKNIMSVFDIIWKCNSVDEFNVRTDIMSIPVEAVNFAVCYMWMTPCRWFSFDWRVDTNLDDLLDANEREQIAWNIVDIMHKTIVEDHLPMLEVEDFLKVEV